jgi:hypothetical protein
MLSWARAQPIWHASFRRYARRLDEHAGELAEHFSFYSDTPNLAKAVHYGELAAKHATEVFAYGEAARQLDRVLTVQDLVDPDDQSKCCELLLALGEALLPAGESERVLTHGAPDALALAESLGDRGRAFRVCRLALDCLFAQGSETNSALAEYLNWAEQARSYANPDSIERIHADLALATAGETRKSDGRKHVHCGWRPWRSQGKMAMPSCFSDPRSRCCIERLRSTGPSVHHWYRRSQVGRAVG